MVMIPFFRKGSLTIWLSLSGEMWLYLGLGVSGLRLTALEVGRWGLGLRLGSKSVPFRLSPETVLYQAKVSGKPSPQSPVKQKTNNILLTSKPLEQKKL